jgi:hypothetical protein
VIASAGRPPSRRRKRPAFSLQGVDLQIRPVPSEAERAAIEATLELLEGERGVGRGGWWEAGVRENLEDEAES